MKPKVKEEWQVIDSDSKGNPRSFAIVEHEPQQMTVIDHGAPIVSPLPAQPPRLVTITQGTHIDRARAFGIETLQLSWVTGGLFAIAAWALAGAALPLVTLGLVYFAGFALTWLIA